MYLNLVLKILKKDDEIKSLLKERVDDSCYEDSELKTMFFFFNYALIDCLGKFVSYKESVMDMENIMKKSPIIESAAKETIEQIKEKTDVINKSSTDLYNLLNGIVKTKKPKAGGARQ